MTLFDPDPEPGPMITLMPGTAPVPWRPPACALRVPGTVPGSGGIAVGDQPLVTSSPLDRRMVTDDADLYGHRVAWALRGEAWQLAQWQRTRKRTTW